MRLIVVVSILLVCIQNINAQDPQFSQYYSAPLILNPAFAGATECYRANLNSRAQWIGLDKPFYTIAASIDMSVSSLNSGFGFMVLHDNIGMPRLSSNEVSGFYSFIAPVHEMFNVRFGLQGTYVSRNINYSRLLFEDQFSGTMVTDPSTDDPVAQHDNVGYADFSAGILFFGENKYWLGASAHHMNRPDQAFYLGESRLPVKFSIHGGLDIWLRNHIMDDYDEMARLVPTFNYKMETKFDQLDLGLYYIKYPIMLGAWYRGIAFKQDEGIRNNDAVILQASFTWNNLTFGYSFDFTTSRLGVNNTLGTHEISLVYLFCLDWPPRRTPPRSQRKLPCPDAIRSMKHQSKGSGF